ncbi:hypothetical protein BD289DRAFT_244747 [Coniella lustricola]|uniref:Secreted protein n=1 Tax=Coniella lustricola TaxID=2025994 RepID=A0A2T3A908_9PEZI|nr:hypothetical protein BD289DRAFT_244747 [Coniella lustricola]
MWGTFFRPVRACGALSLTLYCYTTPPGDAGFCRTFFFIALLREQGRKGAVRQARNSKQFASTCVLEDSHFFNALFSSFCTRALSSCCTLSFRCSPATTSPAVERHSLVPRRRILQLDHTHKISTRLDAV